MSLAALERAKLLSRPSTPEERRQYVEQLLTLPAYKDPQLTTYFAESISLYFAETEDLQDQAVDAVLDLCEDEDEKTRISGIQALARIGKVEPRWVKGNTGVLLQLLESPPNEVKHVRQALNYLLEVSPADVLSMMAEDCRGEESETGASRRNVLDFLQSAKEKRAEVLESGHYVQVEKVFADGFYELLKTTAIAESRQILGLLLPLSTISGRNATLQSTGKFAKELTRCLHSNSSVGLTTPLLRLWAELDKRKQDLDPRWTIYFLADHGAAIVSLVADKDDKMAKDVLLSPTRDVKRLQRALDQRATGDLDERKLLTGLAEVVVKVSTGLLSKPLALELALYTLYMAVIANKSTRDAIRDSTLRRKFNDLGRKANDRKLKASETDVSMWRNIRDMAETIGDQSLKPIDIRPTWLARETTEATSAASGKTEQPAPVPPVLKSDTSAQTRAAATQLSTSAKATTRQQQPPAPGPQTSVANASLKPTRPVSTPPVIAPDAVGTEAPAASGSRVKVGETTPSDPVTAAPAPSNGFSIRDRAKEQKPTLTTASPIPSTSGFSIRSRASQVPTGTSPQTTLEVAPPGPSTSQGLSIRSAADRKPVEPASTSLLSRLSNMDGKRARDTDFASASPRNGSFGGQELLVSRDGDVAGSVKRPRTETPKAKPLSLLERMSKQSTSMATNVPVEKTQSPLSIKNRATSGTPKPPTPMSQPDASSETSPSLAKKDDGVIRKGRGFASRQLASLNMVSPAGSQTSRRDLTGK